MTSNNPLKEAEQFMTEAKKALATSVFQLKFSPDHNLAAHNFQAAGQKFQQLSKYSEAIFAYKSAAEQREIEDDNFSAGRCFEDCGKLCCDFMKNYADGMLYYDKAVQQFKLAMKAEIAVRVVLKKQKILVQLKLTSMELL